MVTKPRHNYSYGLSLVTSFGVLTLLPLILKKCSLSAATAYVIHLSDTFTNPALSLEDTLLSTKPEQFKLETLCTRWLSNETDFHQDIPSHFDNANHFPMNVVTSITFSYWNTFCAVFLCKVQGGL